MSEPTITTNDGAAQHDRSGTLRRMFRRRDVRVAAWIGSAVVFLIAWQLAFIALGSSKLFLSSPQMTFATLGRVIEDGTLATDLKVTASEFAIGLALAVVVGVAVGLVIGYVTEFGTILRPWLAAGYSTPLIALTPLFIVWFGLGIWSKVAIAFIVMVFPIMINTALGVRSADSGLVEMLRSFGGNERHVITKIVLRGSLPYITTGCRLAVGRGLTATVAAELLASQAGMGYRILYASQSFSTDIIQAYVIVLAVIGAVLMTSLEALDQHIARRRST